MNRKVYIAVGVLSAVVGFAQLYQAIYDRPAGSGVSTFGIVVGLAFVAVGAMFLRKRQPAS
jgi:hypothetical protein